MGEDGQPQPMSEAALVHLFNVLKDNVYLVLVECLPLRTDCRGLAEVIPCAIGISAEISDVAAITFAAAFYQALGFGRNIQRPSIGKNALMNLQTAEDHLPRFVSRRGASDSTKTVLVAGRTVPSQSHAVESPVGCGEPLSDQRNSDNLLHAMWDCLDADLQDAFSLAYNKKRRQGGHRISTKDFFKPWFA